MKNAIENLTRERFLSMFAGVFEHSAWVANAAWNASPFSDINSIHTAMCKVVRDSSREDILKLLKAHPELAGEEAKSGTMTDFSVAEQATTGLNALSKDEAAEMDALNVEYVSKHGFPMIIAVRNHTKESIFSQFYQRISNDTDTEIENSLQQIFIITKFRMEEIGKNISENNGAANPR